MKRTTSFREWKRKQRPRRPAGTRYSGGITLCEWKRKFRRLRWRLHPFRPLILLLLCAGTLTLWQEYTGTGTAPGIRILPGAGISFGTVQESPGIDIIPDTGTAIACSSPHIIDGDTLTCAGRRIRLASIDAPEMPGHCRPGRTCVSGDPFAAKRKLHALTRGAVKCQPVDTDVYGRTVARCQGPGGDLSCAMVSGGFAVERYGRLRCGG